ncbi:thiamine pyrophosphate-binding protein [Pseudorhodoplanes sp.]|uniref:thiamine pyrophosphate-binding protein n=1 Tax=Pseudorhodoplanes sp. TaxID=1934341 RepID=UPI003D14DF6E
MDAAKVVSARREPKAHDLSKEWPLALYETLRAAGVSHMSYVPDAGHSTLIRLFHEDPETLANVLTTEEEGVAIAVGAWLGGKRSIVLMQSSGVGNCINMLSLPAQARTPLLLLVTMRGEWAEFNPWQVPMGRATQAALEAIGMTVLRAETAPDLIETVEQATIMAYETDQQIAILIAQRLVGKKQW